MGEIKTNEESVKILNNLNWKILKQEVTKDKTAYKEMWQNDDVVDEWFCCKRVVIKYDILNKYTTIALLKHPEQVSAEITLKELDAFRSRMDFLEKHLVIKEDDPDEPKKDDDKKDCNCNCNCDDDCDCKKKKDTTEDVKEEEKEDTKEDGE